MQSLSKRDLVSGTDISAIILDAKKKIELSLSEACVELKTFSKDDFEVKKHDDVFNDISTYWENSLLKFKSAFLSNSSGSCRPNNHVEGVSSEGKSEQSMQIPTSSTQPVVGRETTLRIESIATTSVSHYMTPADNALSEHSKARTY